VAVSAPAHGVTARAIQFARAVQTFWGRDREAVLTMAASRRNIVPDIGGISRFPDREPDSRRRLPVLASPHRSTEPPMRSARCEGEFSSSET